MPAVTVAIGCGSTRVVTCRLRVHMPHHTTPLCHTRWFLWFPRGYRYHGYRLPLPLPATVALPTGLRLVTLRFTRLRRTVHCTVTVLTLVRRCLLPHGYRTLRLPRRAVAFCRCIFRFAHAHTVYAYAVVVTHLDAVTVVARYAACTPAVLDSILPCSSAIPSLRLVAVTRVTPPAVGLFGLHVCSYAQFWLPSGSFPPSAGSTHALRLPPAVAVHGLPLHVLRFCGYAYLRCGSFCRFGSPAVVWLRLLRLRTFTHGYHIRTLRICDLLVVHIRYLRRGYFLGYTHCVALRFCVAVLRFYAVYIAVTRLLPYHAVRTRCISGCTLHTAPHRLPRFVPHHTFSRRTSRLVAVAVTGSPRGCAVRFTALYTVGSHHLRVTHLPVAFTFTAPGYAFTLPACGYRSCHATHVPFRLVWLGYLYTRLVCSLITYGWLPLGSVDWLVTLQLHSPFAGSLPVCRTYHLVLTVALRSHLVLPRCGYPFGYRLYICGLRTVAAVLPVLVTLPHFPLLPRYRSHAVARLVLTVTVRSPARYATHAVTLRITITFIYYTLLSHTLPGSYSSGSLRLVVGCLRTAHHTALLPAVMPAFCHWLHLYRRLRLRLRSAFGCRLPFCGSVHGYTLPWLRTHWLFLCRYTHHRLRSAPRSAVRTVTRLYAPPFVTPLVAFCV